MKNTRVKKNYKKKNKIKTHRLKMPTKYKLMVGV